MTLLLTRERFSSLFPPGGPKAASGRTPFPRAVEGEEEGETGVERRRGRGEEREVEKEEGEEEGRGAMEAVRAWVSARKRAWSESQDCGYLW